MIVYKITNNINGKVYIGITKQTLEQRYQGHISALRKGDSRHLYLAMREYGEDNFSVEQIDETDNYQKLLELESHYVSLYDSYNKDKGYNMTGGGDSNPMEDNYIKEKHDKKMRSEEVRSAISETMKKKASEGTLFTEEHKKKISEAFKGTVYLHKDNKKLRVKSQDVDKYLEEGWERGNGTKLSSEHKKALLNSLYGRKCSDETRKKFSESHKGQIPVNKGLPVSEEKKNRISETLKNRNRRWINNKIEDKIVDGIELQYYLDQGYKLGKIYKPKNK